MAGIITGATNRPYTDKQIYDAMVASNQQGVSNEDIVRKAGELGMNAGDLIGAYQTNRPDLFAQSGEIMQNVEKGPEGVAANLADPRYQAEYAMDNYVRGIGGRLDGTNGLMPTPAPTSAPLVRGGGGGGVGTPMSAPIEVERLGDPTPWNVTAPQTVEGRIQGIINGAIGQQARAGAIGQMNERGLTNSGLAITAADAAAYQAAIPIATADAATYAKAAGYNADQSNQFSVRNADYGNQAGLAKLSADTQLATTKMGNDTQLATAQLSARTQMSVAQLNAENQKALASLEGDIRIQAQNLQNQNQVLLNTSQQAASAFNQYLVSATNIQMSTTLDAANKDLALRTLWQTTQTQLQILGAVNSLDLTSLLSDLEPISTPAPTPAPGGGIVGGGNEFLGAGN